MATITYQEEIKKLNVEGYQMSQDARALIDQYQGKERPADVTKQIDDLLEKQSKNREEVERLLTAQKTHEFYNDVDTKNHLPIVSKDEVGNDQWTEYQVGREIKMFNAYRAGELSKERWTEYRDGSSDEAAAFKASLLGNRDPRVLRYLKPEAPDDPKSKIPDYLIKGNISAELKTALNEGTTTQGGFLAPSIYAQEIIIPLANQSWTRQIPRIRTINITSDSFRLPKMAYTTAAVLTTETSAYDEKEPTFTEQVFAPYKYTREVKASEEILEDSRFDLWGEIIQPDVVQAFALAENTAFAVGTGSSQPEGFTINAPVGVNVASGHPSTLAGPDDIQNLYFALDFKYRPTATWVMNDSEQKNVRTLKDSDNRYILADNINNMLSAPQATILGLPVRIHTGMAALANAVVGIVLGDFSYFVIADRTGIVIIFADQLRRATGQVSWFIRKRFDSHMMNTAAFTALVHTT